MALAGRGTPRKIWLAAGAAAIVGFALYWFAPWHLVVERRVDEAFPEPVSAPVASGRDGETGDRPDGADARPVTLADGTFRSLAHATSGSASILRLADGSRYLRLEDLDTDSGPDLRVYLSEAAADAGAASLDDAFVDLGALKVNAGDQNYRIPDDVDLAAFESVAVWCRRFSVGFGVASLMPAA